MQDVVKKQKLWKIMLALKKTDLWLKTNEGDQLINDCFSDSNLLPYDNIQAENCASDLS